MAYNRIGNQVYEHHNWCKNCNLVTKDKSVMRCTECGSKVRMKARSFGKKVIQKVENRTYNFIKEVVRLQSVKQSDHDYYTTRTIIEKATENTGICLIEI